MDFDTIVNKCIDIFSHATSGDSRCSERYQKIVSQLEAIRDAIGKGTYPRNFSILPLSFYIERHMDTDGMYEAIAELNKWYIENYQTKSETDIRRENVRKYLIAEAGLSECKADEIFEGLTKHKDIYLEFAEYVVTRAFPNNGVQVCGYNAETLHAKYPLSPLGAYNYLIYLREMPEEALRYLKDGWHCRKIITSEQEGTLQAKGDHGDE